MGAQLLSNPDARQEKEWVSSVKIIHLTLQSTWNCMLLQKISTTALKWLNSARVARYQQAQIKNLKRSNRAQRQCPPAHWFSLSLVASGTWYLNSCHLPTKLTLPWFPSKNFTEAPKYVKMHFIAENSHNHPEMTEQCLRCSLPTGSEASDQKS